MLPLRAVVNELLSDTADLSRVTDLKGKLVLLRVDYNVPVSNGQVEDYSRVDACVPTVQLLQKAGAKVVMLSHLGRPQPDDMDEREMRLQFSLSILTSKLQKDLGRSFVGVKRTVLDAKAVASLRDGQVRTHAHHLTCHCSVMVPLESLALQHGRSNPVPSALPPGFHAPFACYVQADAIAKRPSLFAQSHAAHVCW
jgi:Phosphoglycerate kinase